MDGVIHHTMGGIFPVATSIVEKHIHMNTGDQTENIFELERFLRICFHP
jgi:hypothetical protein